MGNAVTLAGDRWSIEPRHFTRPIRVITATDAGQVRSAIDAAEEAARAGDWVVGYVSYQAAPGLDPNLRVPAEDDVLPLAWFGVYQWGETPNLAVGRVALRDWAPGLTELEHADRVEVIRRAIRAGDTYQVNLTFPMTARLHGDAPSLFATMLRAQPQSFGAHIDLGDRQIVSVSPELFLRIEGRRVTTMPMKGTAKRGRWPAEDSRIRDDLVGSEKERAGNLMIVDMVRNDLGRVARSGSVEVSEPFRAERHPTVWQLTSTVQADLEDDTSLADLFAAVFPCGSVTGAPKVSTMRIISELEPKARGVYCGAIGYLAPGGESAEFSVAIRTGVVDRDRFTYHVGGGITYDSVAFSEYDECLWKALVVTDHREPPDLVETMRFVPGEGIPLLSRHIARLAESAGYWDIPFEPASIGEALSGVEGHEELRVRLVLYRDGGVEVSVGAMPFWDEPVPLTVSPMRIDRSNPLWFHKTADRSRYPVAVDEGEVILVNQQGEVTETNRSNLMVHLDGRWVTPPVASGLLPGVSRGLAVDEGRVVERRLTLEDLRRADELAVTNALRGWRKAVLIG